MEASGIIVTLALLTFACVIGFALFSKSKVEDRMEDDSAPKSTLAADKRSDGTPADV